MDLVKIKLKPTRIFNWLLIGLNTNPFEGISNSIVFYFKTIYILLKKEENVSNFFLIIVNENKLYLKMLSLFQAPIRKVILYPETP